MTRRDNLNDSQAIRDRKRLAAVEKQAPVGFTAVTRGGLRVASAEGLRVEGSERVTGLLIIDGTLQVAGTQTISGTVVVTGAEIVSGLLRVDGTAEINGAAEVNGPLNTHGTTQLGGDVDINGSLDITGLARLLSDLIVEGGGKITVQGEVPLELSDGHLTFASGGTISGSSSGVQMRAGGGSVTALPGIASLQVGSVIVAVTSGAAFVTGDLGVSSDLSVVGNLTVFGAKNFGMEHPAKPGVMLRHAATESPVSGIEYWGEDTIGGDGTAEVQLPDYFRVIAKPAGQVVFVTGRGHCPDWTDIDEDHFTVTGEPGRRFSWLVKAERIGGDFDIESPMPARPETPSPPQPTEEETA